MSEAAKVDITGLLAMSDADTVGAAEEFMSRLWATVHERERKAHEAIQRYREAFDRGSISEDEYRYERRREADSSHADLYHVRRQIEALAKELHFAKSIERMRPITVQR